MKLASQNPGTSNLTPNTEALSRCALALTLKDQGDYEGALGLMRPLWRGVGERPDTQNFLPEVAAEVLLCTGILTREIGSRNKIKGAQEIAKNLISESISYFESQNDIKRVAQARTEIAYCYWREGEVNEARIMLHEALERLTAPGIIRARALLKLAIVEQSAARYYDALQILTDNAALFAEVTHHPTKGDYHNELAMTLEEIAVADKRPDYFQRALTEYKAADYQFKLARNHVFRASVKNNEAVVLSKLGRFVEAHRHLDKARRLTVRFKDRTRTSQIDITRAEVLLAEGKFEEAEAVAHKTACSLETSGQRFWVVDALIAQGTALARLGKPDRAHHVLRQAIEVAHETGALNKAGLAALTLVEEVDLDPRVLHAAYQQAHEWLADSQSQQLLTRVNDAARKLASSVGGKLNREDAIDVLLRKPGTLESKVLEYENALIKRALIESNGAVTHAATLLGTTYQGLAYIIETRHRDLLSARSPVRRRHKKLIH